MQMIIRLWNFLSRKRKYQLIFALMLTVIAGVFEYLTIALFFPLITSYVSGFDQVEKLESSSNLFGLVFPSIKANIVVFVIIAFASLSKILSLRINYFLAAMVGADLGGRCFSNLIYKDYLSHIYSRYSDYISLLTNELSRTVSSIASILTIFSSFILSVFLLISLIKTISFRIIFVFFFIFAIYFIMMLIIRVKLLNNSRTEANSSKKKMNIFSDATNSIKDIILGHKYKYFIDQYKIHENKGAVAHAQSLFLLHIPRYLMEFFLFSLMILIITINNDTSSIEKNVFISQYALLFFAAIRLLPLINTIYASYNNFLSNATAIDNVIKAVKKNNLYKIENLNKFEDNKIALSFSNIKFDAVSHRYSRDHKFVLNDINLTIYKGEKIALIGESGSGKSTLADILSGLLKPKKGRILIDNKDVYKNLNNQSAWQRSISFVSQGGYLMDTSIKENIAFGVESKFIDNAKVKKASQISKISKFIENLPDKYETFTGTDGGTLSGGQKQRLSIARALYKSTSILILDEPTSSLDEPTARLFMESILNLDDQITVFVITHNLMLAEMFKKVIKLDNGYLSEM